MTRAWNDGDRVEFEIGMPLRLESVDAQNPDLVALMRGPLCLFGTGDLPARLNRSQLLGASRSATGSDDFVVLTDAGKNTFRPFSNIADEPYRLYHKLGV